METSAMLFLDALLRFATLTLLVLASIWLAAHLVRSFPARLGVASFIAMAAQIIASTPPVYGLPNAVILTAQFVAVPLLALNWLFALAVLEDGFVPRLWHWIIAALLVALKGIWLLDAFAIAIPARSVWYWATYVGALGVTLHILAIAIAGFRDDLVEGRRRLRIWLFVAVGLGGLVAVLSELVGFASTTEGLIRNAITLAVLGAAIIWLTDFRVDAIFPNVPEALPVPTSRSNASEQVIAALEHAMQEEKAYTQHGLTIPMLAERLNMTEHRLRHVINSQLGFRNFAAFLNRYRIAQAKKELVDAEKADLPIITIAIDAGYTTLSTFNRAFKAEAGMTPSEWRAKGGG